MNAQGSTNVFCRIGGKLAHFLVDTADHAQAIYAVKTEMARTRTKPDGAVLACIEGGKK